MNITSFKAKIVSLENNPIEIARELRKIARELEMTAKLSPALLSAQIKDNDGYQVGVWALEKRAV